ncbi:hypothetical protein A0J61_09903 [Choanephora cucurbitarum]|uniref:Uncharacterized protein n=1 Tax=Choanephora cucurbitarum TaxID=101091 RepID=A0A1C7N081_9FUNG|nr:hypothetical protein A0J61_09903 [Choanephora cucurbitarum]
MSIATETNQNLPIQYDSDTLVTNEQQLREEIAALKREEEKLKEMDEKLKHDIEIIHEKRNVAAATGSLGDD